MKILSDPPTVLVSAWCGVDDVSRVLGLVVDGCVCGLVFSVHAPSIAFTASPMAFMVSAAAASLACLVSLGAVVWLTVVSTAFLATAASSLASPTPHLGVSSISVVLSFMAMIGFSTFRGSQVHQMTPKSRESGGVALPQGTCSLGPSPPPPCVSTPSIRCRCTSRSRGIVRRGGGGPPRGSGRSSPLFCPSTRGAHGRWAFA